MTNYSERSRSFLQTQAIHSQWQSDYLNPAMDRFYDLVFSDIIERIGAKSGSIILDAGCGYCYHTVRLARSGANITAVDFSEAALKIAHTTVQQAGLSDRVSLEQADLTALPFPEASFDFVVSWGVLMHIPQLEKALSELVRVLKTGGILVLSENNMHSLDIAIRERAIYFIKKIFRKSTAVMTRTPRGIEMWDESEAGGLMVRKTDMKYLSNCLATFGLKEIGRTAGQLSEAYTNFPTKPLKQAVYAINNFYYRIGWPPQFACGNVIYFRKES